MARKRSPETEVRHLRRELKQARDSQAVCMRELEARRRVGAMMANFCFNVSQDSSLPARYTETMRDMRIEWDAIKREGK